MFALKSINKIQKCTPYRLTRPNEYSAFLHLNLTLRSLLSLLNIDNDNNTSRRPPDLHFFQQSTYLSTGGCQVSKSVQSRTEKCTANIKFLLIFWVPNCNFWFLKPDLSICQDQHQHLDSELNDATNALVKTLCNKILLHTTH